MRPSPIAACVLRTLLVLLLPSGVAMGQQPAKEGSPAPYLIAPRDVIAVTVADQPSLSGKFTVVEDGTVTYPLLGTLDVAGLSAEALERRIASRLADGLIKQPVVSVAIDQAVGRQVFVTGEVRQQGRYAITERTTVLEVLLQAGGLADTAGSADIVVVHRASDPTAAPRVAHLDYGAIQRGDRSQNVVLEPGDLIFVPRREASIPVYVTGLVKTPGLQQVAAGATVLQAIAQAGGVSERGSTSRLTIIRRAGGRNVEVKASLEDIVQPSDTIVVKRRFF